MSRRWIVAAALWLAPACAEDGPAAEDTGQGSTGDGTEAAITGGQPSTGAGTGDTTGAAKAVPLVDLALWTPVLAADDPWAAERPAAAVCEAGYGLEDGVFEVDTEICTFGTFVQPTLANVSAGDELELILLHDALYSEDESAEAHVAIALGGAAVWETTIPIPNVQDLVRPTFAAPADAPAGTAVHFHVHNHGYNNYRMVGLTAR